MPETPRNDPISVLFVCMGNICRSPLAEGLFCHKARGRGVETQFIIDSAGTGGWHVGERPDRRVREVANRHGVNLNGRARQVNSDDFDRFDHLICMADENRRQLEEAGAPDEKLRLLLECDPAAAVREVPDPYYGGRRGFETVYGLIDNACEALLDELLAVAR
ncbi:MAG: low molecular weight protein-tyrosine-phosphatase [Planctomycetota bacterium]|jgi:protein-tyrosine phosphatase